MTQTQDEQVWAFVVVRLDELRHEPTGWPVTRRS